MNKLLLLLSLLLALVACTDDNLATGYADQPRLSADTVHIGMLLAGNSSQTYQLKLYNPCADELRLTSIALRDGETSGFRMNVDGMNGTVFDRPDLLRIARHDSLFVFIEATFPPTGQGMVEHTDYIDICCNGRVQTVVVDAQSKDVLKLYGEVLTADAVWERTQEVQIYDSLVIAPNVTLVMEDSVTLYLHDKADIVVYGTLQCKGKPGSPVTLRGDRTDKMFDNLPYDNLPSQWGTLYLREGAKGCSFEHTDIRGMAKGVVIDSTDVIFNSCRLKNSDGNLLSCHMSQMQLMNSELSNAAGSLFEAYGGWYDITHCTLANYNFAARIRQEAVHLCNFDTAQHRMTPLHRCTFTNTIVWGDTYTPDVNIDYWRVIIDEDVLGNKTYADSVFCYKFDHCLLRAKGEDDNDFIETLWNEDPKYLLIDDANYTYDFHLQPDSKARGAGTTEGKLLCPLTLDGQPRADVPDLGCY